MTFEIRPKKKSQPNGYSCYRCGRPATRTQTVNGQRLPVCNSNRH